MISSATWLAPLTCSKVLQHKGWLCRVWPQFLHDWLHTSTTLRQQLMFVWMMLAPYALSGLL